MGKISVTSAEYYRKMFKEEDKQYSAKESLYEESDGYAAGGLLDKFRAMSYTEQKQWFLDNCEDIREKDFKEGGGEKNG